MAVLPGPEDVGPLPDPTPRTGRVGRWNPSVISSAADAAGRGLENLGTGIVDVAAQQQDQANQLEVAQAKGTATAAEISGHAALPNITDPNQLPAIQQGFTDARDAALSRITNPRLRAMTEAEMLPQEARLGAAVTARGTAINNDQQIATYEQNTNTTIGTGATLDNDEVSQHSLDSVNQNIDGLVKGGSITAVQGQLYRQRAVKDYISARERYLEDDARRTGDTSRLEAFAAANAMPGAAPSGPAPGANGYGAINAPYLKPVDQPGEGGQLSPSALYTHLISSGATQNEALMITGAAANESSFNPNAVHDKDAAGNPRGFGLFGHNLQRLDMRGKDPFQQADAALQELRSRPEGAAVNAARTPEDLADAEMRYEAPRGYSADNPRGGDNYTGRLNTIRYFSSALAGGGQGGAQAGASSTAIPRAPKPDASNSYFIGDSIADGLRRAAGAQGDTAAGRSPEHVLDAINDADPADLQGKTIYLSTGASNSPGATTMVHAQLDALKEKGVDLANVRVVGVGDRKDFVESKVNDQLAAIAKGAGAVFTGPLDPSNLRRNANDNSDNGVHAADWSKALTQVAGLNDMNAAASVAAQGIDPSGYAITPPKNEWPVGTSHVVLNGDGTPSYVALDGTQTKVPGIRPTGVPDAPIPPHPTGSIIDHLPPQDRAEMVLHVHNVIDQINQAKQRASTQRDTQTSAAIKNASQQMIAGQPVSDQTWAAIRDQAAVSTDPTIPEQFARADAARNTLAALKGKSPAEVQALVDGFQADYTRSATTAPPGDPIVSLKGAALQAAQAYEKTFQSEVAKDPLGRAAKDGVLPLGVNPVTPGDPNIVSSIQKRVADAQNVADFYKLTTPKFLLPQERVALRTLSAAGGQPMVDLASAVVAGAGTNAGQIFKEIGADAPAFASVGALALQGAPATTIKDIAEYTAVARDPEARRDLPRFNEGFMRKAAVEDPLGTAANGLGMDAVGRVRQTANILAGAQAMHDGTDPKIDPTVFGSEFFKQSYNKALGASYNAEGDQYGGVGKYGGGWFSGPREQKILVPLNLKAEDLGKVLGSLNDADLASLPSKPVWANGSPMKAATLRNAHLDAIPNKADGLFHGRYVATIGDPSDAGSRPVLDANGKPWVLDMNRLEGAFRSRFPGSYLDVGPTQIDRRARTAIQPYAGVPGITPAAAAPSDSETPTIPQEGS